MRLLESSIREDLDRISRLEPDQKAILYRWINYELMRTLFPFFL